MKKYTYLLPLALNLSMTGCSVAQPFTASVPVSLQAAGTQAAGGQITVRVAPAKVRTLQMSMDTRTLDASAIDYYRVSLFKKDAEEGTRVGDPQEVSTSAIAPLTFTGLGTGETYFLRLEAFDVGHSAVGDGQNSRDITMSEISNGQNVVVTLSYSLDVNFDGRVEVNTLGLQDTYCDSVTTSSNTSVSTTSYLATSGTDVSSVTTTVTMNVISATATGCMLTTDSVPITINYQKTYVETYAPAAYRVLSLPQPASAVSAYATDYGDYV